MALKTKGKRKKREPKAAKVTAKDYRYPNEISNYWQGMAFVMIIVLLPAGGTFMLCQSDAEGNPLHNLYQVPVLILLWPVISILVINWLAARPYKKMLKTLGPQAKTKIADHPQLKRAASDCAKLFSLPEPDIYIIEDEVPTIEVLPGKKPPMFVSTGMMAALSESQLRAAIAHHLAFVKGGYLRMRTAITYVRSAKPIAKALLLPVSIFATVLRNWMDVTEYSGDRAAVLFTGSASEVNAMMLKLAVVGDPLAQIETGELDEFLQETGELSTDSTQIERHFKIGNFIANVPNLKERVTETGAFLKTEEGKAAAAKVAEVQRKAPA